MSRPLRIEFPDAIYHVMSRGIEGRDIYDEYRDYAHFKELLEQSVDLYSIQIYSYCMMPNHYHLFFSTPEANLSSCMQWLNTSYTVWFNKKHQRKGHLFQGRYKAVVVEDDAYFAELSRYIHLNPVRARLVERPEEWHWSSYGHYIGTKDKETFILYNRLLRTYDTNARKARHYYAQFVRSGIGQDLKRPWDDAAFGCVLGGKDFVQRIIEFVENKKIQRTEELPPVRHMKRRFTIQEILGVVGKVSGIDPEKLLMRSQKGEEARARKMAVWLSRHYTLESMKTIAEEFGMNGAAGVNYLLKQVDANDPWLKKAKALLRSRKKKI